MVNDDVAHWDLPAIGFVRAKQLSNQPGGRPGVLGISRTTLWRMVADGEFPAPVKLSPGVTAWRVESVREWIATRQ